MSAFQTFTSGVTIIDSHRGYKGSVPTRIVLWERAAGSTAGILFVSVIENERGVSTERFSGSRRELAQGAFEGLARGLAIEPSAPAPVLTAGQKAALTRKLRKQGLAPVAAPVVKSDVPADVAERRRQAGAKAAATRKARQEAARGA
jgi:hypothetical protein